ncbi:MAG TPA: phosphatase PAP2 family protein [Candidatus Cybelea sp.]|nr:phosphatase PAP2 family protein [Candidatus Cybelea sp.]
MQPATSSARGRYRALWAFIAILLFAAFYALGRFVVADGEPAFLLQWERALFDHSTLVAWWLTWACYPDVLIPICIALLIVAWLLPAWRQRAFASIILLLLCWRTADFFQHVFARPRPLDWVVKHETAFSYPSSHAAIVAGFYWLWAAMLYGSNPNCGARKAVSVLLVAFGAGICWSRLALGAHYVTDLIGGVLLGFGFVAAAAALVPGQLIRRDAGRISGTAE